MKNILLLIALLFTLAPCYSQQAASRKAPEIALKDTSGKMVKLSELKGKVVLIDFWASWCGPCRRANKQLKKLYAKYKSEGLEILSISTDNSRSAWKRAITEDKTPWLHVIDEMNVAYAWQVQYLPTTFLIDKEGNFAAYDPELSALEGLIKKLVK